jgi:hypothetical protein
MAAGAELRRRRRTREGVGTSDRSREEAAVRGIDMTWSKTEAENDETFVKNAGTTDKRRNYVALRRSTTSATRWLAW